MDNRITPLRTASREEDAEAVSLLGEVRGHGNLGVHSTGTAPQVSTEDGSVELTPPLCDLSADFSGDRSILERFCPDFRGWVASCKVLSRFPGVGRFL